MPNINVCAIDWSKLASEEYNNASEHVYTVGAFAAETFKIWNLAAESITLVGHSLGAQVAGHIGKEWNGKIKRIYGKRL